MSTKKNKRNIAWVLKSQDEHIITACNSRKEARMYKRAGSIIPSIGKHIRVAKYVEVS